ncbi:MAG: hypothetical protein ACSHYA_07145 [Opitutaceae bacterium]
MNIRKVKAFAYALMGFMMCWNTYQKGHYTVTASIAFFTVCAIAITLAAIGTRKITWNDSGITITQFPTAPKDIPWAQLEKLRVDHLGYHIRSKHTQFKVSKKNMPESLLKQIRESIRQNNAG